MNGAERALPEVLADYDEQTEQSYRERERSPAASAPAAAAPKITARLVQVTPKMAEKLLARNTHNRGIVEGRVLQYAADMAAGNWQINGEAIKIAADGQILDGQHRLLAITEARVDVQTLVITGLPNETQETMDQGRPRSFADVLKLRGEKDYYNLAATVLKVCVYERDRVPFSQTGRVGNPTIHQLTKCLNRNPELRDSVKFAQAHRRAWLGNSAVAALHFLFSTVDEADATDFFARLATGESLEHIDPRYVLRERLIKEHHDYGGMNQRVKLAFIVRTWNAWRTGEILTRLVWTAGGARPDRFPEIDGMATRDGR